jgi:hypothetical protein
MPGKSAIIQALRDGAQSASNGVAKSLMGDPVDGAAWLLRKAGVPVGDMPVGGTDWLTRQGITPQVEEGLPSAIGMGLGQALGNAAYTPKMLSDTVRRAIK